MSTKPVNIKTIKLQDGTHVPQLGLGTFNTQDRMLLFNAIKHAVQLGFRLFDSAWVYQNEDVLGQALKESIDESGGALRREDFFVTSKVWNTHHDGIYLRKSLNDTLTKMGLDYLDLYMIHWPISYKENDEGIIYPKNKSGELLYTEYHYINTYRAIEDMIREKKVKKIGLCNFNKAQICDILTNCSIRPSFLQIEVHPYFQNDKLIEFCQNNNIQVMAYAPIGADEVITNNPAIPDIINDEKLIDISQRYDKTSAQVCIRWCLQRDLIVIVKSLTPEKITEYAQVFDFDLNEEEMNQIKKLNKNLRINNAIDQKDHVYYPFKDEY